MRLLGDWNWWLPAWLDRWLPDLDIEGGAGLPEPEYEPGRGPRVDADGTSDDDRDGIIPEPALAP
jgi:hypothetical protein